MYCTNIFGGSNYKGLNNKTQAERVQTVYGDREMLNINYKGLNNKTHAETLHTVYGDRNMLNI